MAIQIEQEQSSSNWIKITLAVVIILVIFVGAYFLFFKSPELIEVVAPGQFENLSEISELTLDANELLDSPKFRMLRQFSTDVDIPSPGKNNPFEVVN